MFCRKCGNEIDYNAEYCNECSGIAVAQAPVTVEQTPTPAPAPVAPAQEGDKKTGFKKGMISTILSGVGVLLVLFVAIWVPLYDKLLQEIINNPPAGYYYIADKTSVMITGIAYIFYVVAALGLCIPSVILGIFAVITFVKEAKAGRVKPVVTLVLGCIGLVLCIVIVSSASGAIESCLDFIKHYTA